MPFRPFPVWLQEVANELRESGHTLTLSEKEKIWLQSVWQHYQISPAEAALFFINEYDQ